MNVLRGSLAPYLQQESYTYSPTNGYLYRATLRGMSQPVMLQLEQDYVRAGVAHTFTLLQGGNALLEIEDSTQQYTLDVWEIKGNDESRDIFSHPSITTICTDDQIGYIRAGINNVQAQTSVAETITTITGNAVFSNLSTAQKNLIGRFIGLNLRGTTDFRRGLYVLHHVTNVPNIWSANAWNVSDVKVGYIYSPAELLTEVTNAGFWYPILPTRLQAKLAAVTTDLLAFFNNSIPANYQLGWLKGPSTETTTSLNRSQIVTEYTLEVWSSDLYPYFA